MTSHELARKLLEGPDVPVCFKDEAIMGSVTLPVTHLNYTAAVEQFCERRHERSFLTLIDLRDDPELLQEIARQESKEEFNVARLS